MKIKLEQADQLIKKFCSKDWAFRLKEKATESAYKANSIILKEGEKVKFISIVKKGKVKIYSSYGKNTERIYRFASKGQIIGHRGLGKQFIFPITAFALTDTATLDIPLSLFKNMLKANSLFCYHFLLFFAEELRQSERQIKDMVDLDLRQRISKTLIINAEAFGFDPEDNKKLAFTISRKDISHLASTTYESVIRTLSDFQKEKIIALLNKEIRIIDYQKLRKMHG